MQVGDLVKFKSIAFCSIGIIIETGAYVGNKDVKVFWDGKGTYTEYSKTLEVISESR